MKRSLFLIIGISLLAIGLSSYQFLLGNNTIESDNNPNFNSVITKEWAGDFKLGAKLVAPNSLYQIITDVKTYPPEQNLATEKRFYVTMGGDTILELIPNYDFEKEEYGNTIKGIFITSSLFQTAKKVGVGTTLEQFAKTYPDYNIFYSIYSDFYVATSSCDVYFNLDAKDGPEIPKFTSEITKMPKTSFSTDSKIVSIELGD